MFEKVKNIIFKISLKFKELRIWDCYEKTANLGNHNHPKVQKYLNTAKDNLLFAHNEINKLMNEK